MVQLALPHSCPGAMTALIFRFVMYDGTRNLVWNHVSYIRET